MSRGVDVLAVLQSQLSWIGPCRPDGDEIDCERWDRIEESIAALSELIRQSEIVEDAVNILGMSCGPFSTALARVRGAA